MEYKVYQVVVDRETWSTDWDGVSDYKWETMVDTFFASKSGAIRAAQSKFARQPLNDYVRSVQAVVYRCRITDKGMLVERIIYNKYKTE